MPVTPTVNVLLILLFWASDLYNQLTQLPINCLPPDISKTSWTIQVQYCIHNLSPQNLIFWSCSLSECDHCACTHTNQKKTLASFLTSSFSSIPYWFHCQVLPVSLLDLSQICPLLSISVTTILILLHGVLQILLIDFLVSPMVLLQSNLPL